MPAGQRCSHTGSLADAASLLVAFALDKAFSVDNSHNGNAVSIAQAHKTGCLSGALVAQGTLGGSNDTDSLAVDGTKCGIDVAAITSVQLGQAACIGNSLGSALGIILDQVERSGGSFEIKHSGASQARRCV